MISTKLQRELLRWGASLVGFAELKSFLGQRFAGYPNGISIAVQLSNDIVNELTDGPTKAYAYHYHALNRFLDNLAIRTMNFLQAKGYAAWPVPTSQTIDWDQHKGHLSHKLVATRAGLGWVGKNALLITPEFGPRVRLTSILTDAPLKTATPIETSQCEKCSACVKACPVGAIRGETWSPSGKRADLFVVDSCAQVIEKTKSTVGAPVCGVCIQACPKGFHSTPK